ncbi:hypothetical protein [Streptomyces sp. NPDC051546]|uniref:hypothetical protein n=1 Tax=Streptomyces sp. NPDC051546 TaxID=3365655 RepID=UPI0037BC7424
MCSSASPGGRDVGGELGLDDVVGVRVVDGARRRVGEQLPLGELRLAADVVDQVSVAGALPGVEPRLLEGRGVPASVPLARRRTTRRPMRAWSTGTRRRVGAAVDGYHRWAATSWSSSALYSW